MNTETQPHWTDTLAAQYPDMFPRSGGVISVSEGWRTIIESLVRNIDHHVKWKQEQLEKYGNGEGCQPVSVLQVKEKFGCYDELTEVLTESGWKKFADVGYDDKLATISPTGHLEYEHPTDLISYNYTGSMYRIAARGVDLLVTPNHRMLWAKGNSFGRFDGTNTKQHPLKLETPSEKFRKPKRFEKGCLWDGGVPISSVIVPGYSYANSTEYIKSRTYTKPDLTFDAEPFLKLLGMIVSEGYISEKEDEVAISACNDGTDKALREQTDWETIIKSCNLKFTKTGEQTSAVVYRMYNSCLARWCKEHIGCGAPNKRVPQFVKNLPGYQIKWFLDYLYKGDGYKTQTSNTLYTTSKQLSDDVQELLLKVGATFRHRVVPPKQTRLASGVHDCHCINWLQKTSFNIEHKTIRGKNYIEQWEEYSGMVFCATVPNGTLYVRRNGKGVWCGNSLRFYYNGGDATVDGMTRMAEAWASHTCETCGERGERRDGGWIRTLCDKHEAEYQERIKNNSY